MHFDATADGRGIADTAGMHAITHRPHATIRVVCRGHRGPEGYDVDRATALLAEHRQDVPVLTAPEAESLLGIPANRIHQWAHLNRITPVDREHGQPRYQLEHLVRLDELSKDHPRRRKPRA